MNSRASHLWGATRETLHAGSGEEYSLDIAIPEEPPPPAGYPTLYMLDGGAFFGTLVEMVRLRRNRPQMTAVESSIVVGIGHPDAHPYDRARRRSDFMPPDAGSTSAFLDFLTEDLHPLIEARADADPERRVLLGHSLAGAFVLDALCTRPVAHHGYVAISPSIWAYGDRLFDGVDTLAERTTGLSSPRRVMVAVGQYDQEIAPWQEKASDQAALRARRAERAMVDRARAWCMRLAGNAGSAVEHHFEVCAGEDHASVLPVGLSRALRFVAGVSGPESSEE